VAKSVAKRHHFISQCYLRGFAADPGAAMLHVSDFKVHKQFRASTSDVALEKDFHTVDIPGQPPDVVEKQLGTFESDLGPALRRIVAAGSLADDADRSLLFFFMALLTIKNPRMRDVVGAFMSNSADMMMRMKASDPRAWEAEMLRAKAEGTIPQDSDTEQLRNLILQGAFAFSVSTPGHLHVEFDLVGKLLPYFHGRKWTLCRAVDADRTAFVTSDDPVCLEWRDQTRTEPPGLGRRGTAITFPVANELAIIGTFEGQGRVVEADDNTVAMINGNVIAPANRQIYARADDFVYVMPHNARTMRGSDLLNDPVAKQWDRSAP
jgi:hypothetical protein